MKPCNVFNCTDKDSCAECYNGKCMGSGYDASQNCGCEFCEYSRYVGDQAICAMKTYTPTRKISELRENEEFHDWPEHEHRR